MAKTIHYVNGCAWANGQIQQSDTFQTTNWYEVTCKHCLRNRPIALKLNAEQQKELDRITREIIDEVKKKV